jgi:hypothetical protein
MIYNQGTFPECKGYWFLTALSIINKSIDSDKVISAINENEAWLLTNRKAGEFFKSRGFIKDYEEVPRLKAKALLNRWIPLIANIIGVDWENTGKAPYIAVFNGHIGAHSCTIVWYDNNTRILNVANTWWEWFWDKWHYYIRAVDLDKVTSFCKIII